MAVSSFPFFDPNRDWGWPGQTPFMDTPLGDIQRNISVPEGEFTRWLSTHGYGGMDAPSQAARGLLGRYQGGYAAGLTQNPDLKWTNYLQTVNPRHALAGMGPQARGEQPGRFGGRTRWMMRQF